VGTGRDVGDRAGGGEPRSTDDRRRVPDGVGEGRWRSIAAAGLVRGLGVAVDEGRVGRALPGTGTCVTVCHSSHRGVGVAATGVPVPRAVTAGLGAPSDSVTTTPTVDSERCIVAA